MPSGREEAPSSRTSRWTLPARSGAISRRSSSARRTSAPVFFLAALFPNFLHHEQPLLPQFAPLFATLIVVVGTVHFGYALFAAAVQSRLGARRFRSAVQTASGFALLGFSAAIFGSVLRRT